jgi:hypothetical protein
VTKSPADTEALPAFLASNFSLIVMGIHVPFSFPTTVPASQAALKISLPPPLLLRERTLSGSLCGRRYPHKGEAGIC